MEPVYRAVFNALYKVGSIFLLKFVYRLYQPNLSKHLDDDCKKLEFKIIVESVQDIHWYIDHKIDIFKIIFKIKLMQ